MGHIIVVLVVEEVGCRHFVVEQVTVPNKNVKFEFNDKQLYIIMMKNNSWPSLHRIPLKLLDYIFILLSVIYSVYGRFK